MKKQTTDTVLQTGFKPLPNAQTRVWNRLQTRRPGTWKRPAARWAFAACLTAVIVWCAAVWTRPEPKPMLAAMTAYEMPAQHYGEAGPCGLEYNLHYIPFQ